MFLRELAIARAPVQAGRCASAAGLILQTGLSPPSRAQERMRKHESAGGLVLQTGLSPPSHAQERDKESKRKRERDRERETPAQPEHRTPLFCVRSVPARTQNAVVLPSFCGGPPPPERRTLAFCVRSAPALPRPIAERWRSAFVLRRPSNARTQNAAVLRSFCDNPPRPEGTMLEFCVRSVPDLSRPRTRNACLRCSCLEPRTRGPERETPRAPQKAPLSMQSPDCANTSRRERWALTTPACPSGGACG